MDELSSLIPLRIPRTIIGMNASAEVGPVAKEIRAKKALIVTDPGVARAGLTDTAKKSLEKEGITVEVFDQSLESAPIGSIVDCARMIKDKGCDLVVGIGGGSVLDLAKVAAVLASHNLDTKIIFDSSLIQNHDIKTILLPTTAGTGSEVNMGVVCTDEKARVKIAFRSVYMWPDAAIIDPVLTLNLPPAITADTGFDVLSHAIEAFTSNKANMVADTFAEKAIRLAGENLRPAYTQGAQNPEARYKMMLAASLGILSARSSAAYIVHSLSYPLGFMAHLSHGRCCALMLPHVMDYNFSGNPERFARVAELLNEPVEGLSTKEKARKATDALRRLMTDLKLPQRLTDVGLTRKDIPAIVEDVFTTYTYGISENPREIDRAGMRDILESAL